MKKPVLILGLLLLTGCFETQFHFQTAVDRGGTVNRVTRIEGRGAVFFKAPEGGGWQVKSWDTKGAQTLLLPDTVTHILAQGKFRAGEAIPPDYQFDLSRQMKEWGEKEKAHLEASGIKAPYEEHLFSRNAVRTHQVKGLLAVTIFYEETFQNAGLIPILLADLKEEVKKQNTGRAEALQDSEIEVMARLRLENEILPEIRFRSDVELPGKIVTSNGRRLGRGKVAWEFSMKDFQEDYSDYTLRAMSRSLRLRALILLGAIGVGSVWVLILAALGIKRRGKRKRR